MYFSDFNKFQSFLNGNISSFTFASDEVISFFEMFTESVVSIDDSEAASVPTDFPVFGVPVPH
jgi:hypothetical protein